MITVIKNAIAALESAAASMRRMQQRQPHVNYSNDLLYGKINASLTELRAEVAKTEEVSA